MGKHDNDIVRDAGAHVFAIFREAARDGRLLYHGYDRSRELAAATREIARGCDLDEEHTRVATLAAWFYDSGYTVGPQTNRADSVAVMRKFLESRNEPADLADAVEACMLRATDHAHDSPAEEVLHDALLVPMAGKSYLRKLRLLRLEKERRGDAPMTDVEWTESCIRYVDQNPFRTRYAQVEYNSGRAENVVRLHNLLNEQRQELAEQRADEEKATKGLGKTVEGLYNQLTKNQLQVLNLSDRRTATMVHVNAIMISLIAGLLLRHLETHRTLLWPTMVLLAVNLVVIFISIASMRVGRLSMGVRADEFAAYNQNLLTLVNSAALTREQYATRIDELARDTSALRKTMTEALWFSRRMITWRGKMLRVTYDVFIVGLLVSLVAFAIAIIR